MKKALITTGILALIVIGVVAFVAFRSVPTLREPERPVACTMDAKQCPDGSYVGRIGPKCEFAACPDTPSPILKLDPQPGPIESM